MVAVIGFGVNYDFGAGGELPTPVSTSLALETERRAFAGGRRRTARDVA